MFGTKKIVAHTTTTDKNQKIDYVSAKFNVVEHNAEMDAFVSDAARRVATKRNMQSNRALTRNFRWTK